MDDTVVRQILQGHFKSDRIAKIDSGNVFKSLSTDFKETYTTVLQKATITFLGESTHLLVGVDPKGMVAYRILKPEEVKNV